MLRRVAIMRTDVSEKPNTSIIRVTRIGELGTLAVTSNYVVFIFSVRRFIVIVNGDPSLSILIALIMEAQGSFETSV
jgi:hypothetical protein